VIRIPVWPVAAEAAFHSPFSFIAASNDQRGNHLADRTISAETASTPAWLRLITRSAMGAYLHPTNRAQSCKAADRVSAAATSSGSFDRPG